MPPHYSPNLHQSRRPTKSALLALVLLGVFCLCNLQRVWAAPKTMPDRSSKAWPTPAEESKFTRTPRYEQTVRWLERLDGASNQVHMFDFGRSSQGRALKALVLSSEGVKTPEAAHATGKPVLLIQAAIHPGENEGKDTLMALARDITVGGESTYLEHVVLVLIPIFNVDGHERFSPYNRINQNGPEAMGWRTTAQNLNLNRDFVKADSPEMQAWLRLWQQWHPDLLVDMHNTNGADYQYEMTWAFETQENIAPELATWQKKVFDQQVKPALLKQGWKIGFYVSLKESDNPKAGLTEGASSARFSVGYAAASGRPGLLLETHMLKDFRTRTRVNEALLREMLVAIGRDPGALKRAVSKAAAERFAPGSDVPLAFGLSEQTELSMFLGLAYQRVPSELSGGQWTQYDPKKPETMQIPVQRDVIVTATAKAAAAYVLPPQWHAVSERLQLHGVQMQRLEQVQQLNAERYRFTKVAWAPRPFEGRHSIAELESQLESGRESIPAGSWLIPMAQPKARLIAQMLEPQAPDSFLRWGFFDAIFESKEYAEPRVMEGMAREMLKADPKLKAEFEQRLQDAEFAASPAARLQFFYERSPYFDRELNRYPVLRLDAEALQSLMP
jgi:hypothetical protein